jgi:alpha-tubulin suppressor-like RCC1 family protein
MTKKGVWDLQEVRDEYLEGNWDYVEPGYLWLQGAGNSGIYLTDISNRSSPHQIPGTTWNTDNIKSIIGDTAVLVKTDGTLWAWGYGTGGVLGLNDRVNRSSPTQIPGTQWDQVMSCRRACFATKTDGTLWSWGDNSGGCLGINITASRSSPTQIGGTQWSELFPGGGNTRTIWAKKSNGTLWSWGYNNMGNLGISNTASRSSPVQLPGTQWDKVTSYTYGAMALKTDGSLWRWGYNGYGELGMNQSASIFRSSPIQLPGTWTSITNNQQGHSHAVKSDGKLWSWGQNTQGQLGINDAINRSSPIQVPGTQWTSVECTTRTTYALKTDGTLWIWGDGASGRLGNNDIIEYSSPIQLPGTLWDKVFKCTTDNVWFLK